MIFEFTNEYNRGFLLALCLLTVEYSNWLSYMGNEHSKWKLIFAIICEVSAACSYFASEW